MTKPSKPSKSEAPPRRAKRRFTEEFKLDAVRLVRVRRAEHVPAAQVARELGIGPGLLSDWIRQFGTVRGEAADAGETGETLDEEVRRLRREVAILKQEREFAKKAAAFFAKESL
jgi:transposase